MPRPFNQQQIQADLAVRRAAHQAAIAAARQNGIFGQPASPLVLLAAGDSWFDYPLGGAVPLVDRTDIIAQLPSLCVQAPRILKLAHYGDTLDLAHYSDANALKAGREGVQLISDAIDNPANGEFDAILFSSGGNDIVGDPFCIWLNDADEVGNDPARALHPARFEVALQLAQAAYLDLIRLRNDKLPHAPIFVHGYDFAIPSGVPACLAVGPWLKPALDFLGWTNPAAARMIVHDALSQLGKILAQLAADPGNNLIYVPTQGTLASSDWANELHPQPQGFIKLAAKFHRALARQFPGGRI